MYSSSGLVCCVSKLLMSALSDFQHLLPGDCIISVQMYQPLEPGVEILATAKHTGSTAPCAAKSPEQGRWLKECYSCVT